METAKNNAGIIIIRQTLLIVLFAFNSFAVFCNSRVPVTLISKNSKAIAIQQWLLAGPFPSYNIPSNSKNEGLRSGYSNDFLQSIGGESKARIKEGTMILSPDGTKAVFACYQWDDPFIDLVKIYGESQNVCAYLYAEVESKEAQEVFFHVGIDDAGKVWLNGRLIVEHPMDGSAIQSQNRVKVMLKPGRNPVLVKVDQAAGKWGAYVEIYGSDANKAFELDQNYQLSGKYLDDKNKNATIIETKTLCKQTDRYIGWPTIAKTKSNELLVTFSGNRDAHVCPYGITQMIRSKDNGKTWSTTETINNTPLDDRDAGILETNQGTLLVSWFTSLAFENPKFYKIHPEWERHDEKLNKETKQQWLGNWTRRSTDMGKSWEEPVKQIVSAPHGPIVLADSSLLYVGTGEINSQRFIGVEVSQDDGQSWKLISTIEIPEGDSIKYYSEPHVVETSDGNLVAMFRYNPEDVSLSYLHQSESFDGGKSWTVAHKTPVWGYPPHLLQLSNGWLLAVYGVRRKPYSERACLSKDQGKSWDIENEIILSLSASGDLGYPSSVQLDDGSIFTVYYQIDQPGEKTCLMATHWKLK